MKKFYQLLRINHYIKNFLVFIPLLFTSGISNTYDLFKSFNAFLVFCILASSVYIINDVLDLNQDKKHPKKRRSKPLASGVVSLFQAQLIFLLLIFLLLFLIYFNYDLLKVSLIYLLVNFFYTTTFKKVPYLDLFILSSNYILRVYMGCVALSVDLSGWMASTVFFGALFISSLKRKQELFLFGSVSRKVLKSYSINSLEKIVNISAILSVLFYSLYIILINQTIFLTIPLVVYGVIRYISRSKQKKFSDSPVDEIINDKQNILLITIWLLIIINTKI
jgi:4-hydroxybenzoate polyprenyltransferase